MIAYLYELMDDIGGAWGDAESDAEG
jgi:hypothetical protein